MVAQCTLKLSGNVLDVTYAADGNLLLVSVDGVHEPGSTTAWRDNMTQNQVFVECFETAVLDGKLAFEAGGALIVTNINTQGTDEILQSSDDAAKVKERKVLSETLYSYKNFRKR
jgi:hypothetical protein